MAVFVLACLDVFLGYISVFTKNNLIIIYTRSAAGSSSDGPGKFNRRTHIR